MKNCERCGMYLGEVHSLTKYCRACKDIVDHERKIEWAKNGGKVNYGETSCEWCGKPMVKRSRTQKYHKECQPAAYRQVQRDRKARQPKPGGYGKKSKEPKIKSVQEVTREAEKMGMSYGELSLLMAQGKI